MNSFTDRRSPQDFIAKAQEDITTAAAVHPCVAVTEKNWSAMINAQQEQIQILTQILHTLPTLATHDEIQAYMDTKLTELTTHVEQNKTATADFRKAMKESAKTVTDTITELTENAEKQDGKRSEEFSKNLSSLQEQAQVTMRQFTKRMLLVATIPSVILLILELVRHVLSVVSGG